MSISPLPTPLQQLGARRFSFYPAILNLRHNEWIYRRATWSEIVVVNTQSGEELCIPRIFIGEVSIVDHPVIIVGLRRELEWNEGVILPHRRPVIEMPLAVNDDVPRPPRPAHAAQVVNIRLEQPPQTRKGRKIAVAMMLGAMACLVAADIARQIQTRQRPDYSSMVRRLGPPAFDRALKGSYRLSFWPRKHLRVIFDSQGRVVDSASVPEGSNAADILRSVPAF